MIDSKKLVEITNHVEGQRVLSPFSNSIAWNDMYINIYTCSREVRKSLLYSFWMAHNLLPVMSSITFKVIFGISVLASGQKKVHFWHWKHACFRFILIWVALILLHTYRPAAVDDQNGSDVSRNHQPEPNKLTLAGIFCFISVSEDVVSSFSDPAAFKLPENRSIYFDLDRRFPQTHVLFFLSFCTITQFFHLHEELHMTTEFIMDVT